MSAEASPTPEATDIAPSCAPSCAPDGTPNATPDPLAAQRAQDAQDNRRMLRELAEIGLRSARRIEIRMDEKPDDIPALAESYERVSRSVRRSLMLADRATQPPEKSATDKPAPDPVAARKRVLRDVEDAIHCAIKSPARAETLAEELHERIDNPSFLADLATRPLEDLVTDLVRDLGLTSGYGTRAYKRRTPEDIRILERRAADPAAILPRRTPEPVPEFDPTGIVQRSSTAFDLQIIDKTPDD